MRTKLPLLALTLLCLVSNVALAWGNEGHRIAALIANEQLTDKARSSIRELIGTDDLSIVATYLDDNREELEAQIRGSSRWHYENREICGASAGTAQCPQGDCVTRKIEHFMLVLKNKQLKIQDRAEAIRVLVHLIADLHQPLHLIDNHDRGGNDVFVLLPHEAEPRRLHEVWDSRFIHSNVNRRSVNAYARALAFRFKDRRETWLHDGIEQWAAETFAIGKRSAYEPLPGFNCGLRDSKAIRLPPDYVRAARNIVDQQLAKAGSRTAYILNSALN